MEELEKRVASLKMENARLNEYVSTLEDRIRFMVETNVQKPCVSRATVGLSLGSDP